MRASRIFRWVVRIIVLFLTTTMSIVSVLGGLSAVNILSNPNNIQVPAGEITNYNLTSSEKYVVIPINITNAGYFDLNDLYFGLRMELRNSTASKEVHNGNKTFGTIKPGEKFSGYYNATNLNINIPPTIANPELYANITISAKYSIDLLSFRINIFDFNITSILGGV